MTRTKPYCLFLAVDAKAEVKNDYGTARNCAVKNSLVDSGGREVAQSSSTSVLQPGTERTSSAA